MTGTTTVAQFPRYAIYFVPPADSALYRFGSTLLGYDAFSGRDLLFPDEVLQILPEWRDLTRDPRRYGFHATLKAPFSLAPDQTEAGLRAECEEFAGRSRRIASIEPVVKAIDGFIAVVAVARSPELMTLARDCVADFDHFRAPMTDQDRKRRNPSALTLKQRECLERWGYPYVMDEFRFHMTLSGRLPSPRRETALAILNKRFSELNMTSLAIDRIALFRQHDEASQFVVIDHFPLRAPAAETT